MCSRGSFLLFLLFSAFSAFLAFLAFLVFLVLSSDNAFTAVFLDFKLYRVIYIKTKVLFT